jgi:hypothetical protein
MVDKLGTEVDSHEFFNTLIFDIELPNKCAKVCTQPIDTWDTNGTRMVNNDHHESHVAEMQLLKLETQSLTLRFLTPNLLHNWLTYS